MNTEPVTVREMFDYAVSIDLSRLAHSIYWALSKQLVQANDNSEKLQAVNFPKEQINKLVESNLLGIGRIGLFVIETKESDWYAFHLAENALDATRLHRELFRESGGKVVRSDRLMIELMLTADGKEESLYERKKNIVQYPAYVGHARAGEHSLYKVVQKGWKV